MKLNYFKVLNKYSLFLLSHFILQEAQMDNFTPISWGRGARRSFPGGSRIKKEVA